MAEKEVDIKKNGILQVLGEFVGSSFFWLFVMIVMLGCLDFVGRVYDWRGELMFTALAIGLFLIGINIKLVSILFSRISKELGEDKVAHRGLLTWIVVLTFSGVMFLWIGIGAAPNWLLSEKTYEIILPYPDKKAQQEKNENVQQPEPSTPIPNANPPQVVNQPPSDEKAKEEKEKIYDNPGIVGDQFGMANALFGGLALAGIVLAVLLQTLELKYQRAELRNTRSVFMNSYHLQAMQTVFDSLDGNGALDVKKKKAMIGSLEEAIKYMRIAGEIDKYQMDAIKAGARATLRESEVYENLSKIITAERVSEIWNYTDACVKSLSDIDHIYLGNGLFDTLRKHMNELVDKCRSLRSRYSLNDVSRKELDPDQLNKVNNACELARAEVDRILKGKV